METDSLPTAEQKPSRLRCFHPTPGRLLVILLAVEGILLSANWFHWIPKGWAVLIAVAAVGLYLTAMLVSFAVSLLFRWRFQFSLRSLLLLTLAVAIPFSWLATEIRDARKQRSEVEEIEKQGRKVFYNYECEIHDRGYTYYDIAFKPIGVDALGSFGAKPQPLLPNWLRTLLGDDFFCDIVAGHIYGIDEAKDLGNMNISKQLKFIRFTESVNRTMTDEEIKKEIHKYLPQCKIEIDQMQWPP
jgi:hypothetical protein